MKCLVIVPAYNVGEEIYTILEYLEEFRIDSVIVNDGSTDNTKEIIQKFNIPLINIKINSGVSNAIIKGIEFALQNKYTHVITIDSDGQHSPLELNKFLDLLNEYDYVFGNRFNDVSKITTCKLAANSLVSALYKEVFGIWIPDISCGYKGYKISTHLLDKLKKDVDYSIVFSIINYSVVNEKRFTTIPIDCIYNPSTFLSTRRIEIQSFWKSIKRYAFERMRKYEYVYEAVERKDDFEILLSGINYYAFYLERNDSYIIQADIDKMIDLYK